MRPDMSAGMCHVLGTSVILLLSYFVIAHYEIAEQKQEKTCSDSLDVHPINRAQNVTEVYFAASRRGSWYVSRCHSACQA